MSNCTMGYDVMMYCPDENCAYHKAVAEVETEKLEKRKLNLVEKALSYDQLKADHAARVQELEAEIERLNLLVKIADELITNENAKADWQSAKQTRIN